MLSAGWVRGLSGAPGVDSGPIVQRRRNGDVTGLLACYRSSATTAAPANSDDAEMPRARIPKPATCCLRRALTALTGIACTIAVAACGSSSSPGNSSATPPAKTPAEAGFEFANCMRHHGVSNFPDPIISQQGGTTTVTIKRPAGSGFDLQTAGKACKGILSAPQQPEAQDNARKPGLLAFARCMRDNGVSNFPDPTSRGQLTLEMLASAGVKIHAPNVLSAAKICLPTSGGAITPADIQNAQSGHT